MSELAIAALSGAGVTITVAIVVAILGLRAADAERSAADARVDAANRKGQAALDAETIAELRAALDQTDKRADALQQVADSSVPTDPVGAHARVLARWKVDLPGSSDADHQAGPVPATAPTTASDGGKPNG